MKNKILPFAKQLLSLILFGAVLWYLLRQNNVTNIFKNIRALDFFILFFLFLFSYLPSGIQMRLLLRESNVNLSLFDTLLLPVSMSLWAYIIPANGGFLYSLFFLSKKYNCKLSNSSSVGIFTIYLSFILSGISGVIVAFLLPFNSALICLGTSLLCIMIPMVAHICNTVLKKLVFNLPFLTKISLFADNIVSNCNLWLFDRKVIITNTFIVILQLLSTYILYAWILLMLDIKIDPVMLILIVLAMRISALIRILPGNLGIEEIVTGTFFAMAGLSLDFGLLIATTLRCVQICILPLGIIHSICNNVLYTGNKS